MNLDFLFKIDFITK